MEDVFREDRTLKETFPDYRTLEKVLSQYDIWKKTSHGDRTLKKNLRNDHGLDRTITRTSREGRALERAYFRYCILQRAICQYRKSLLSEMDKSLSAFTKQLHGIDLNTVQILHCLSTFLSIALTSPRSLKSWFRLRTPKLLTATIRAECSELQTKGKEKPESILTLIFEQQNVQRKYKLMEFPIFDRFDDLERLHFPEDFDLPDCRDGYDSFRRFIALLDPINQACLTEDKSLA